MIEKGSLVKGSMNGVDWYSGVYIKDSGLYANYGVLCDDKKEVRYFIFIKPNPTQVKETT